MKIPRDISGRELAHYLKKFGFEITRQTGSHIRLTKSSPEEYHITIPDHSSLKIGTLNSVLKSVAKQLKMEKSTLIEKLFTNN